MPFASLPLMLTDESLRGRTVLSGDGIAVGDVARLIVDPTNLRIEAIQVKLRRDAAERIGAPRGLFRAHTIDIPAEQVQSIGDAVILAVPLEALRVPEQRPHGQPTPAPTGGS